MRALLDNDFFAKLAGAGLLKEVLEQLRQINADVKAIISSGYLQDPVLMNYTDYGFAGILTKPYDPRELDEKLQRIING